MSRLYLQPGKAWRPAINRSQFGEVSDCQKEHRIVYVVIFRATVKQFDQEYAETAARMRELALTEFGCVEFKAATEGQEEIALSYWPDEQSIRAWHAHPEHRAAQALGREKWYSSYSVEVAEIGRAYRQGDSG
jgi:heme-degrading monooxygenase HmoA